MKMKKILLKPFPHSVQKKTHLSFATFSFMMCQIYNTRNKKSRDHGGKNWQKRNAFKGFVGGENNFLFHWRGLCTKGIGVGGKLKFVFFTRWLRNDPNLFLCGKYERNISFFLARLHFCFFTLVNNLHQNKVTVSDRKNSLQNRSRIKTYLRLCCLHKLSSLKRQYSAKNHSQTGKLLSLVSI